MKTYRQLLEDVAALESRSERPTPPPSKPAKPPFDGFVSTPLARSQNNVSSFEDRREWGDELVRDLLRWLSVHPPDVWRAARIWDRITPQLERLEALVRDYEQTGEPGDRRAAVFAANAVAATAARAALEWEERHTAGR